MRIFGFAVAPGKLILTQRPQSSSFLGLPYRILNMNPPKGPGTTLGPLGTQGDEPPGPHAFKASLKDQFGIRGCPPIPKPLHNPPPQPSPQTPKCQPLKGSALPGPPTVDKIMAQNPKKAFILHTFGVQVDPI